MLAAASATAALSLLVSFLFPHRRRRFLSPLCPFVKVCPVLPQLHLQGRTAAAAAAAIGASNDGAN